MSDFNDDEHYDDQVNASSSSQGDEDHDESQSGNPDKRNKFKELAGKRTSNLLDNIRLLGNLSNTASYEYTMEDVDKIFGRIQEDLDEARELFQPRKQKSTTFVL